MSKYQESNNMDSNFQKRFWTCQSVPIICGCIGTIILIFLSVFLFRKNAEISDWISIISIGLSIWTLAVAVYLLTSIHGREKREAEIKEKEQRENSISFVRPIISDAVYWLINSSSSGGEQIYSQFMKYIHPYVETMTTFLSQRNSKTLIRLIALLDAKLDPDDEAGDNLISEFLYREWLRPVMSGYHLYNSNAGNPFDLLSKDLYDLLNQLGVEGAEGPYREKMDVVEDNKEGILYEKTDGIHDDALRFADSVYNIYKDEFPLKQYEIQVNPDNDIISVPQYQDRANFVNVFDHGKLICSGEVDPATSKVANGFVEIHDANGTNEFVGFVKDGLRFGPGAVYDGEHKLSEGYWFSDSFSAGVQYNFMIKDENNSLKWNPDISDYEGEGDLAVLGQYFDSAHFKNIFPRLREELFSSGFDSYYIADRIIMERNNISRYYHFRKLQQFLEDEDPDYSSWLLNLGGH